MTPCGWCGHGIAMYEWCLERIAPTPRRVSTTIENTPLQYEYLHLACAHELRYIGAY